MSRKIDERIPGSRETAGSATVFPIALALLAISFSGATLSAEPAKPLSTECQTETEQKSQDGSDIKKSLDRQLQPRDANSVSPAVAPRVPPHPEQPACDTANPATPGCATPTTLPVLTPEVKSPCDPHAASPPEPENERKRRGAPIPMAVVPDRPPQLSPVEGQKDLIDVIRPTGSPQ